MEKDLAYWLMSRTAMTFGLGLLALMAVLAIHLIWRNRPKQIRAQARKRLQEIRNNLARADEGLALARQALEGAVGFYKNDPDCWRKLADEYGALENTAERCGTAWPDLRDRCAQLSEGLADLAKYDRKPGRQFWAALFLLETEAQTAAHFLWKVECNIDFVERARQTRSTSGAG